MRKHRILLCDDQDLVRSTVIQILKRQADVELVGETTNGEAGVIAALELLPDLVLMDVSMPGVDGREATRRIVAKASVVKVLAYSSETDWETVEQMFVAGARGYVLKNGDPRELVHGIRTVLAGGSFVSPGLMGRSVPPDRKTNPPPRHSPGRG